jgi:type II secretion system protein D
MSRPNRQRAVGGWLAVVVLAWLAPAVGLGQAKAPQAKQQDQPQKAPASQPATQPAAQAGSQPATDAADKYWALQERAASSKPASSKPATQGAEPELERTPPAGAPRSVGPRQLGRSVQPSTRGRSVRPPTARQEQEPARVTSRPAHPRVERPTVGPEAEVEPRRSAQPEEERTEWFVFDGMPWEDVIVQTARRIGKPLMTESYELPTGELTYVSSRKFTKQEAIDELQFLLYDQGFYFLETENYVYVVRLADLPAKLPLEYVYSSLEEFERANPRDMQYVIVYIDVGDERAAEDLCDAFSSFFVAENLPIVPPDTNQVKITALARDVRKFEELRRRIKLEKQDIRRTRVYKFKTNARDIERILRDQLGLAQPTRRYDPQQRRFVTEGAEGDIRITADDRTNTLIVRAKPEDFEEIERFFEETKIDEIADIGEFKTTVIEIQHANAQEIADLLNQIFQQEQGQQTTRFRVPTQPQRSTSSRGRTTGRTAQPQQPVPQDIIVEDIYERAKKTVRLFAHEPTNSLIVYANEEGLGRVREMLEKIDQEAPGNFRTFKLKHAEAEQIHGVVEEIARGMGAMGARGRAALVVLDTTNNALHVIADREEMTRIEAILKELDTPGAAEERHVVELENIAPSRVAQIILPLLDGGRVGTRMPGRRSGPSRMSATPQVIPLDEAGILIVFCSDEQWTKVEETIRLWDSNAVSNTPEIKSFVIKNGDAQTISNTLQMFYRTYTHPTLGRSPVFVAAEGETIYVQAIKPALEEIEALVKSMDIESADRPLIIIPLESADASEVAAIAQGLLPPGSASGRGRYGPRGGTEASLQAEPVTNSLIIQADSKTVERVKEFAADMDQRVAAQKPERRYYTLKNATPREVVAAVAQLFGATSGFRRGRAPVGEQVKTVIVGNQVVVDAPAIKQAEIAALVQELDNLSDKGITTLLLQMPGADVRSIAQKLSQAFRDRVREQGVIAQFSDDPSTETILVTVSKEVQDEANQLLEQYKEFSKGLINQTEFYQLQHANANDVANWLRNELVTMMQKQFGRSAAQQVKVTPETRTNRVIISAPQVAVTAAKPLLEQYDVPPKEIAVEVLVETVTRKLPGLDVANLANQLNHAFTDINRQRQDNLRTTFGYDRLTEMLIVTTPKDMLTKVDELIAQFVAETEGMASEQKFVQIQNADANYVANQLRSILTTRVAGKQGREVASRISILVDTRLNRVILNAPKFAIDMAEALITELDQEPTTESQLRTVALVNADANTVLGILRTIFVEKVRARTLQMSVEPLTNSLIVGGTDEDFEDIKKWAEELDAKAIEAVSDPMIIELKNANPWEVYNVLNTTFVHKTGGRRQQPGKEIRISIVAGRSLVVQAPPEKLKEIQDLAAQLDEIGQDQMIVKRYQLPEMGTELNGLARDIQNAVNAKITGRESRISVTAVPSADTLVVYATEKYLPEVEKAMEQFKDLYQPPKMETIPLLNGDANTVYQALSRVLQRKIRSGKIQISVEGLTNALIVSAPEEDMTEIRDWVAKFEEQAAVAIVKPRIFELKNASPWEVRSILDLTFMPSGTARRRGSMEIRFDVVGGRSIVAKAPAEKMKQIEEFIAELDAVVSNEATVRTFRVQGMGSRLNEFARQIQNAVNSQMQDRDQRIAVTAYPVADTLIVTAKEDQFKMIEEAMELFKDMYTPPKLETIALEYGDANAVYNALNNVLREKMRSGKVQLGVEGMTNSLIVLAGEEDMAEIREWVATFDLSVKDTAQEPQIFELKNANPWEIYNVLNQTFLQKRYGGRVQPGKEIKFSIVAGRSIVVQAPAEKMDEIGNLIAKLDEIGANKAQIRTYELVGMGQRLNEFARQLQNAMNQQASGREQRVSITAYPPADALIVTALEEQFEQVEQMMDQFKPLMEVAKAKTEFFELVYVDASQIVGTVQNLVQARIRSGQRSSRGTQDFSVTADPRTNRLIVFAPETIMPDVRDVVQQLDVAVEENNVVTFELQYADPNETRNMINEMFGTRGRRGQSSFEEVSVTVSNNMLVVKAPPRKLQEISDVIAQVDAEDKGALQVKTYDLKVLNAREVATQVQLYLRGVVGLTRRGQMQPGAFGEPTTNTLVVISPPQHLPFIDLLVAELESKEGKTSEPRTYVLKYARAEQIVQPVDAMLKAKITEREGRARQTSIQTVVSADPAGNRLFIYAPDEYQELAAELIRMIDEDVDTGEIVHIIPLEQADATQLAPTLIQTAQSFAGSGARRGGGSPEKVRITADAGSNSIIVAGLPKDVAEVEELIKELEINSEQVPELQIFQLEYATTMEVADALNAVFAGGDGRRGGRGGGPVDRVTITEDDYYNRLIVTANKRKMRQVEAFIAQLDEEPEEGAEYGLSGGRQLYFVDIYRGDAYDIAYDVQDMLPPEDRGGPSVQADWFGEYIIVKCRPSEFPAVENLIRQFERRARVETVIVERQVGGDIDRLLDYLKLRRFDVEVDRPTGKPKRRTIVEELRPKEDFPGARSVSDEIHPYLLDPSEAAGWFQEADERDPQRPPERRREDRGSEVKSQEREQEGAASRTPIGSAARRPTQQTDEPPLQREPVRVQILADNRIVLSGPKNQVDEIEEAMDLLEEDLGVGEVIRIFKFNFGDVNAAAQILDRMFNERQIMVRQPQQQQQQRGQRGQQQEQQGRGQQQQQGLMEQLRGMVGGRQTGGRTTTRGGQRVRIATDPGHSYLIVKCDESDLPEIRQLLWELDIPPGEVNIRVFQLKNLDANETAQNIKEILGITQARSRRDPFASIQGRGGNQQQQLMQMLQQQMVSIAGTEGGAAKIEQVEIVPNAVTNSLMVSAPPEVMKIIENVINELEGLEGGTNVVIRHYPLENAKVDDVLPLLQEIFEGAAGTAGRGRGRGPASPGALGPVTISGDPRVKTIIFTCEAKDVPIVEEQIRALDIEGVINEAETYLCQWGDAQSIASVVEAIYVSGGRGQARGGRGGQGVSGAEIRIVAESATNTIIVWGPLDKRDIIMPKIKELDERSQRAFQEIPVKFADAEELADKLMQLFGGQAGVTARRGGARGGPGGGVQTVGGGRVVILGDDNAKKLLVRAPEKLFEEIVELVAVLDLPSQELQIRRFDLEYANAEVVVEQVREGLTEYMQIQRSMGKDFDFDAFTALPDPRTNSIVVVGSDQTFLFVETLLANSDVPIPEDKQRIFSIFKLEQADAQTVTNAINSVSATGGTGAGARGGGRRGGTGAAASSPGELNVMASAEEATNTVMVYGTKEDIDIVKASIIDPFEQLSEEGKPFFRKLEYARATNVAETLSEFFSGRVGQAGRGRGRTADEVSFSADPDTNTLIILASGRNREFVMTLIDELDQEEGGREIEVIQLQFADANSAAQAITVTFEEQRRGGRGRTGAADDADRVIATPDVPSNTIIVRANPANMRKVKALIDELEQTIAASFDPVEIRLRNAQASQVASFIWQFLGETTGEGSRGGRRGGGAEGVRRGPQIIPNDNANTLIVRGSQAEVERIRMLAERFDDPEIVATKVKIIEVPLGQDAVTLASEVERLVNDAEELDAELTGRQPRLVVVGADDFTNTLIVAGNPAQFGTVDTIVEQLANIRPGGSVTRIIQFTNLSAEDAVEMINDLQQQQQRRGTTGRSSSPTRRRSTSGTGGRQRSGRQRAMLWSPASDELNGRIVPAAYGEPFIGTLVVDPLLAQLALAQVVDDPQEPDQEREQARPRRARSQEQPRTGTRGQRQSSQAEQPQDRGRPARQPGQPQRGEASQEPATAPAQLRGVQGALRGEVTAAPLDSRRIVITGDPRDVDFIEQLLLAMELDAPRFQIEVFTLKSGKAATLAPILTDTMNNMIRGRVSSPGPADQFSISAEARSNSLIVSASELNMEMIAELVDKLDITTPDTDTQFKAVPLDYMRAVEAVAMLTPTIERLNKIRDIPADAQASIEAIDRSNAILIVGTPPDIEEIENLISAIDIEISPDEERFGAFSEMVVVGLKNGNAEEIAKVLTEMIEAEQENARQAAGARQPGEPVVRVLRMRAPSGEVLAEINLERPIRLIPETGTNSLIIFSTPKNNESMQQLVAVFDTLPVGAEIDVKSFPLQYGHAEQVAELLQSIFDEGRKALVRPSEDDLPSGELPPVPPGIAAQGLPYNITVTHDERSNTVFVIGRKDAVLLAAGLINELDRPSGDIAMQSHVITLKNIQASTLEEKLTDMLDERAKALGGDDNVARDSAIIVPYDRSNSLVILATDEVFRMVEDLAIQLDEAEMYRVVDTRYRHLEYADAMKLQGMLQEVFDRKGDAVSKTQAESKDILYVTGDARSNSLMLTGTRDYLAEAEELIDELDRSFDPTVEFRVRKVRLNSAANIATLLREMIDKSLSQQDSKLTGTPMHIAADPLSDSLLLAASHEDMVLIERWVEVLDRPSEVGRMTRIIPLARASAEELSKSVQDVFQNKAKEDVGDFTVTHDPTTNSVVVIGPPALVNDVADFIRRLDQTEAAKGAVVKIFKLEQADAEDAGDLLSNILEGRGGTVGGGSRSSGSRQEAAETVMLVYQKEHPEFGLETLKAIRKDIVVISDLRTNSLVITAPPESMPLMESLVAAIDVPPDAAKIRVFPLRNADAEDTVEMLKELFEEAQQRGGGGGEGEQERELVLEGGLAEGGRQELVFTTDVRTNSVIAAGTTGYLDLVEQLIIDLDAVELEERTTFVYAPRNIPAAELVSSLRDFSDQEQQRLQDLGEEMSTQRRMEREIGAIANESANRAIVSVHPRMESEILDIVHELDQPPPQVMIQVLILEVTTDDSLELGVEFAFQDLQYTKAGTSDTTTFDFVGGTDIGAAGTGLGGFSFTVTGRDFNFLLRALQGQSSLRILSRPQIVAMDNQEATIDIVTQIPVVTQSTTTGTGQLQVSTDYKDAGIKLIVTPQINPDGFVRMEIEQEVSDFTGSTVSVGAGVNLPIIFKRNANTTVTVKDNETVVLGGLITSKEEQQEQKVPILGDVPGLGVLFRSQVDSTSRTELLIVLTPRVLRTIEDYRDASIEVRDETGTLPTDVLTSPLMKGLRVEPKERVRLKDENLLGPFPSEPRRDEHESPWNDDTYGPPGPASARPVEAGTQVDPNSYDVPITRRFR